MRSETQRWNEISVTAEVVGGGVGGTGYSLTCAVQRLTDSKWLQADGSWDATRLDQGMLEVDGTSLPGLYRFTVPTGSLVQSAASGGYLAVVQEPTLPLLEYVAIRCAETPDLPLLNQSDVLSTSSLLRALANLLLVLPSTGAGASFTLVGDSGVSDYELTPVYPTPDDLVGAYIAVNVSGTMVVGRVTAASAGGVATLLSLGPVLDGGVTPLFTGTGEAFISKLPLWSTVESLAAGAIQATTLSSGALESIAGGVLEADVASLAASGNAAAALVAVSALPSAASIADAVWDELVADHTSMGSAGAAQASVSAAGIAAAVWDAVLLDYDTAGTFGAAVASNAEGLSAAGIASAVWQSAPEDYPDAGTFGYKLAAAAGAAGVYSRVGEIAYDAGGRVVEAKHYFYRSAADTEAGVGAWAVMTTSFVYDSNGELVRHMCVVA